MNELLLIFVLFTVVLLGLFQVAKSYCNSFIAFLICSVIVVCIALGFVGLREGITYNSNFSNIYLNGYMRTNPYSNNATEFTFSNLKLDGNSNGTIY
jgi:hypothetical protein